MEFLHPNLLMWFLPLVAIPVVLHLLTLRRLKTVELSTFRFLFDSYVQQRRKMRLLDAVIAALRTLFLLLVLLAIARPTVRHWNVLFAAASGRDIVLMVDCSASMEAATNGVSAIDRAKDAATTILSQFDGDERVTLVRVTSRPNILSSRVTANSDSVRDQIAGLKTSPSRGNLFAAFQESFGLGAEPLVQPQIYLFTDGQASGWREMERQPLVRLLPDNSKLLIVDVGDDDVNDGNLAVVGEAPSPHHGIVGLPMTLRPRVANLSGTSPKDVSISVLIDDAEIARRRLTVPAGVSSDVEILFTPLHAGVLKGRYQIDGDLFPVDDSYLYTLMVEPRVRVLLVNGAPSADPLMNEGLYLRTAMTTVQPGTANETDENAAPFADEKHIAQVLDVREISEAELTFDALGDRDVAILANCGVLNDQQFAWLRGFAFDGGGLLIMPGDKVSPEIYNQRFFPVTGAPHESLVAAALQPPEGKLDASETAARFATIDSAHAIFSVFDVPDARYLTSLNFFRRYPLVLHERGDTWSIAEFSTGSPAMLEGRYGDGRVLLTAFPANSRWSNFPLKPEFVPWLLRTLSHIRRRPGVEGPSVVTADGTAEFAVPLPWMPANGEVTDADGRLQPLEFHRSTSRLTAAYPQTSVKGYYKVTASGGRVEQRREGETAFAVNLSPEESDFRSIDLARFRDLLPGVETEVIDASAEAQQLHGSIGETQEIWRALIWLTFAVISIEFLLATFKGRRPDPDDGPTVRERVKDVVVGAWVGRMTGAEIEQQ